MLTDESIMPIGTKKGQKLGDLTNGYLTTLYDKRRDTLSEELKAYIETRVPIIRFQKQQEDKRKEGG